MYYQLKIISNLPQMKVVLNGQHMHPTCKKCMGLSNSTNLIN